MKLGFDDPARQTVEVEEVRHHAVELARVRRDPPRQVARLDRVELDVGSFEGHREAQDRRERRTEVVRNGLEERVLHVVQGSQAPRGLPLHLECAFELLLGCLALGDVQHEPLPSSRTAVGVDDGLRLVVDPHDAAVFRDHPILHRPRLARLVALGVGLQDARPIVGVKDVAP